MIFFSKAVEKLNIEGYSTVENFNSIAEDPILNAIMKFKNPLQYYQNKRTNRSNR